MPAAAVAPPDTAEVLLLLVAVLAIVGVLVLLVVVSGCGYNNLVKLASVGWNNRIDISDIEFPVVSLEEVIAKKDGIVFGVPGINGPVTQMIMSRQLTEASTLLQYLNDNLDIRLELASLDAYKGKK